MWNDFGSGAGFMQNDDDNKRGATKKRSQNLLPCSVAQCFVADSNEEGFRFNGVDIGQIFLVGVIRTLEVANTSITYTLDDASGPPIQVKQWIDTDDGSATAVKHAENSFIRVFGSLRAFQGKRNIVAFKIEPVLDYNEMTLHLIEVLNAHYALQHPSRQPPVTHSSSFSVGMSNMPDSGLTGIEKQVLDAINTVHTEKGISIKEIESIIRSVPPPRIKKAIDFLSEEGHIYSTYDESHYKSTTADE